MIDTKTLASPNFKIAYEYATDVVTGKVFAGKRRKKACARFLSDLKRDDIDFRCEQFDFAIDFINATIVHRQGEDLEGLTFVDRPFEFQPWQVFVTVNLFGFFQKGSRIRRFKEALIMIPRKNGKTAFASALSMAYAVIESSSTAKLYILAKTLRQSMESFDFLKYNVNRWKDKSIKVKDNNQEHSISKSFSGGGSFTLQALASNEDNLDSLNCNILILDEVHTWRSSKRYTLMKKAMNAYRNKILMAISTAGDIPNGFLAQRLKYCDKVLDNTIEDDSYFIFICDADVDEKGKVADYTSDEALLQANPSAGVTVSLEELRHDAEQAQNDPQTRNEFFQKTLNIFTNSMDSYFDMGEIIYSDSSYNWTIEELVKLPITWYGGADLSKLHDLTAAALYGTYQNVDIIIPHAFFPKIAAQLKADEDGIPLFGWEQDGWLTMSNTPTVHYDDIINWFVMMRKKGFKIKIVGFDKKFGREFYLGMKKSKFKIVDQPQYFHRKSEGFRRIEVKAKNAELYYCHSEAFEYCIANVRAIEKTDDMIQFEKVDEEQRIDVFDASVFACVQMLEDLTAVPEVSSWFD